MRRASLFIAGLLMAGGASLALATPASAATTSGARHCVKYHGHVVCSYHHHKGNHRHHRHHHNLPWWWYSQNSNSNNTNIHQAGILNFADGGLLHL